MIYVAPGNIIMTIIVHLLVYSPQKQ